MAQTVFRANQVNHKQGEVLLKLNKEFLPPPVEEEEEVPEYQVLLPMICAGKPKPLR